MGKGEAGILVKMKTADGDFITLDVNDDVLPTISFAHLIQD